MAFCSPVDENGDTRKHGKQMNRAENVLHENGKLLLMDIVERHSNFINGAILHYICSHVIGYYKSTTTVRIAN